MTFKCISTLVSLLQKHSLLSAPLINDGTVATSSKTILEYANGLHSDNHYLSENSFTSELIL